ncbi:acyltransferase [Acidobacteria bacterium AB60]|nr:acyltransferase [Acidobacteria bacterium AB60]
MSLSDSMVTSPAVKSPPAEGRPNVQDSSRSPRFFRPELDVLRFFAFCLVFTVHIVPENPSQLRFVSIILRGSTFGVQLFFVLSAYLIVELLSREKDLRLAIDLRRFYTRRILRIWPLYFLVLLVGFAYSRLSSGPYGLPLTGLVAYLFLAGNWYAGAYGGIQYGFGVIWSVNVEEQLYLLFPIMVRFANRRRILVISAAAWIASQFGILLMQRMHYDSWRVHVSTITQLQYFAIGAAISALLNGRIPRFRRAVRGLLIVAGLSVFLLFPDTAAPRLAPFLSAGTGCALILLGFLGAGVPAWMKPLQSLGKISYGLYMIHAALLVQISYWAPRILHMDHNVFLIKILVGLPLTVLLAALSYRFLEKPFLKLKEKFEIVHSRPA